MSVRVVMNQNLVLVSNWIDQYLMNQQVALEIARQLNQINVQLYLARIKGDMAAGQMMYTAMVNANHGYNSAVKELNRLNELIQKVLDYDLITPKVLDVEDQSTIVQDLIKEATALTSGGGSVSMRGRCYTPQQLAPNQHQYPVPE